MGARGIYQAWTIPGSPEIEGSIGAREAKTIGAAIFVRSSVRSFKIYHHDNWGDARFPWRLSENWPVGTLGAVDNYEPLDEFASMREAVREAIRLARE